MGRVLDATHQLRGIRPSPGSRGSRRPAKWLTGPVPLATILRNVEEAIRSIVGKHGKLSLPIEQIRPEDDLYRAGMTSHASVSVMLALEAHFGVEFPDSMLRRSVFESISTIHAALNELQSAAA